MTPTILAPSLPTLRRDSSEGVITPLTEFQPGLFLNADPHLKPAGQWRSPSGRLLELDVEMGGQGAWIGLHMTLDATDLPDNGWIGFACRSAAPEDLMIRPCLRSGTEEGFTDCFFDKHVLAAPEPRNHVDAMALARDLCIPRTAPWRELILFLPRQDFRWHLHDLRPFLA